jgi:hypothetical protein
MAGPILLSALVGGGVSFLVTMMFNAYQKARGHKRGASRSNEIWE